MADYTFSPLGPKYRHISTASTTVVRSGPGCLVAVVVNNPGTGNTVTVYDNTAGSGTVIAVIAPASTATLTYNAAVTTGITVVSAGGTPADVTVVYT